MAFSIAFLVTFWIFIRIGLDDQRDLNRLIVARFASLLKKSGPEVQAIVHQIIEV